VIQELKKAIFMPSEQGFDWSQIAITATHFAPPEIVNNSDRNPEFLTIART
jgi:hypothetical protein